MLCDLEGSQTKFSSKTGIQRQTVSRIISEESGMRSDTLLSIHEAYPSLNIHWLITGTGEMWVGDPPDGHQPTKKEQVNEEGLTKREEELALKLLSSLEQRIKVMEAEIARLDPETARRLGIDMQGE